MKPISQLIRAALAAGVIERKIFDAMVAASSIVAARKMGLPANIVTLDSTDYNYSSARMDAQ